MRNLKANISVVQQILLATLQRVEDLLRGMIGLSDEQRWFFALLCGFTHSAGYARILNARLGQRGPAGWIQAQTGVDISWVAGSVLISARLYTGIAPSRTLAAT